MTIHDDPRFAAAPDGDRDLEDFRRFGDEVLALLTLYVQHSRAGEGPVLRQRPLSDVSEGLDLQRWIREGGMDAAALGRWLSAYLADTTRLHHPHYLGHQVAVPLFPTVLADMVHGTLNNGMAVYEMGAPAVAVELAVLDWMLAKVGWRGDAAGGRAGGVLTHGGSLANLTALLAARAAVAPQSWEEGVPPDLCVLAPRSAHYSIARAVAILGLGSRALLPVETDPCGRMSGASLEEAFRHAATLGRRVMAVVAGAGSTAAGAYDPLEEVADTCARHRAWLHVDGAHGASALLSPALRGRLAGVERADSLVWDAHKLLGTSALCAAVLVRDVGQLLSAFRQQASYLVAEPHAQAPDLLGRTIECTKASLGLKLFLNLAVLGEDGLRRHVEALHERAREFHALAHARPALQTLAPPESNIVLFRHAASDDALQARLRAELVRRGDFYVTQADLDGRRWLRLVVMNPLTDAAAVERLFDQVEELAAGL
ncbi:MAG: diaminobutyrate decarboxylase [Planctomycetes bacterium]|nr:diaminobutyrate decarboxylase [Planctomycetota bacterium]